MKNMTVLGKCPNWVLLKAKSLVESFDPQHKISKKLAGMKSHYSIKISTNYRVLLTGTGEVFVCKHNHYDRKIKNIKRKGV
ncbi:hypothetical protein I6F48_00380 [Pseudoalteromonas sp. SWYJ118]|uniref:ParE family toxin-like protein n=1 Tax=Pseudoalteromonas sp. SWYJ118 TaxID=2792062 RepID=UPI0018CCBE29|nr:hypothetical protein [Pseudoalteromonas sp. SWYJ118]MBH0074020.1 hypothetical protein [Pseudoalteromonas sp. SWYJ118]